MTKPLAQHSSFFVLGSSHFQTSVTFSLPLSAVYKRSKGDGLHSSYLKIIYNWNVRMSQNEVDERDLRFMRLALEDAEIALERNEIPVGCIFVGKSKRSNDMSSENIEMEDVIIARGSNKTNETRNGSSHAEMNAIQSAIEKGEDSNIFSGSEVFVTCEPCIMCAAALSRLGVKRVVFGCLNERFGGNGSILNVHKDGQTLTDYHSYSITSGVMAEEAIAIFQKFYVTENKRAPLGKRKRKSL